MSNTPTNRNHRTSKLLPVAGAALLSLSPWGGPAFAAESDEARALFQDNCAVCHGADRGGYIAPELNSESLGTFTPGMLESKIITGGLETLMPPHPTFFDKLSRDDIKRLAAFIKTTPKEDLDWNRDAIEGSLEVLVADESALPDSPGYAIDHIDDLMAVMARGRYAAGEASRIVFFDGRRNAQLGHVQTDYAPHLIDFHPTQDRWAYATTDTGWLYKIDLYSLQAVRRVRVGLNGPSLAVSRDGRYVGAGSFSPNTAVILDAQTLEPVKYMELEGTDPDGRTVESDCGAILATPFADYFVIALEQAGEVWIVDLAAPDLPVSKVTGVGRHLHDAFLSPDGRRVAMASYDDDILAIIDLADKRVVKRVPAGRQPHVGSGAVIESQGRTLGVGTNIGLKPSGGHHVTVFDMESFEVVKQIPVLGPTESPAAHPAARYLAVDIVGEGTRASRIQMIDKDKLSVSRTIDVGGHSHFPEYTARGDYLYVSAGYMGDSLVVYDSESLERVQTFDIEVPAGIFSHSRASTPVVGLQKAPR